MPTLTQTMQTPCDERLPLDGSKAWAGMLLVVATGAVSLRGLVWLAMTVGDHVMR